MPVQPSFVNGFVQISAVCTSGTCYVVMAQDFNSFAARNTVFNMKIHHWPDRGRVKKANHLFRFSRSRHMAWGQRAKGFYRGDNSGMVGHHTKPPIAG
ncbi:hypothetical protein C1N62_14575 [Nissabacter sp. SGAir0207]|nr:hypothetical protein C1N62_14575 [Nissabacter sp. SGAir0207]